MPYINAKDYRDICERFSKQNEKIRDLEKAREEQEEWICELKEMNIKLRDAVKRDDKVYGEYRNIKNKYDSLETALDHYGGDWDEEIGICVDCENYKGFDEMKKHPNGYYCVECYENPWK